MSFVPRLSVSLSFDSLGTVQRLCSACVPLSVVV
jgi:hypothetical protein